MGFLEQIQGKEKLPFESDEDFDYRRRKAEALEKIRNGDPSGWDEYNELEFGPGRTKRKLYQLIISVLNPDLYAIKLKTLLQGIDRAVKATRAVLNAKQETADGGDAGNKGTVKRNFDQKLGPEPPPYPATEKKERKPPPGVTTVKVLPPVSIPRRRLFADGDLPARRIAPPDWGQTETQTAMKPIFTVRQSLERREFGSILHEPIAAKEDLYRRDPLAQADPGFEGRQLANFSALIRDLYAGEIAGADEKSQEIFAELGGPAESPTQLGFCFIPTPDPMLFEQDRLHMLIGLENIADYFAEFRRRAIAANQAVTGTIPLEVVYHDNNVLYPKSVTKVPFEFAGTGKIASVLGVGDFPIELPLSFLRPPNEATEGEIKTVKLNNYWELFDWLTSSLDDVFGEWPQIIKIADSDPLQSGNQPIEIPVTNIATALSSLLAMLFDNQIKTDTIQDIGVRTLIEAGLARKEAIVASHYAEANATYLNYKGKEKAIKVPYTFRVPEPDEADEVMERLDLLLKESQHGIKVFEYDDKNEFQGQLQVLLQAAAIIRAKYYYRMDGEGSSKDQIMGLMRRLARLVDAEPGSPQQQGEGDEPPRDNFDRFLEKVENGFTGESGMPDPERPYGDDPARRPKIKRITRG